MYIENVAPDNTDASGKLIPGGIDLENIEVKCWNGGNWGPRTIAKNSYLTHDCGNAYYHDNWKNYTVELAPADLYYQGKLISKPWEVTARNRIYARRVIADVNRGTMDSIGNSHYCLKMVNGNLTISYNENRNCPRTLEDYKNSLAK